MGVVPYKSYDGISGLQTNYRLSDDQVRSIHLTPDNTQV